MDLRNITPEATVVEDMYIPTAEEAAEAMSDAQEMADNMAHHGTIDKPKE